MPVVKGRKTDKEKRFAGAEATYTIEAMMKDHKALQSGTSHYFGDKFSRAYDVTFTGRDNKLQYPFQTSWGATTRLIGACIMTHSDNNGLVLPPAIAPIQVIVLPIAQHKAGVLDAAAQLRDRLEKLGLRVKMDDSEQSPGWKFAQYEMKGVPLRVEIGPKDMEKQQCCIARRDTGEKTFVPLSDLESAVQSLLQEVHHNLYAMAEKNLEDNTFDLTTWEEVKGDGPGQGRLCPHQVVRQPGVRAGHEGKGRGFQPLYAAQAVRHHRQMSRVRQGMHHGHLLGRGVLRHLAKNLRFFLPKLAACCQSTALSFRGGEAAVGIRSFSGGKRIAAPVCALARNDIVFQQQARPARRIFRAGFACGLCPFGI